ncbi:DUF4870 domain-containing protein [Synechococcus moorigangaii CMS01]|nr:DUF4870 domain-containing protein [Synechococcus moorigangaii CMS01]
MTFDPDKRKLFSSLCHGAIFINYFLLSVLIPLALLLVSEDPVVKDNAKESLNLHLNLWAGWAIFGILWITVIGIPIAIILAIPLLLLSFIMPILAILKILGDAETRYRYPFIFHLL